mgnify:CR=1 FL=1
MYYQHVGLNRRWETFIHHIQILEANWKCLLLLTFSHPNAVEQGQAPPGAGPMKSPKRSTISKLRFPPPCSDHRSRVKGHVHHVTTYRFVTPVTMVATGRTGRARGTCQSRDIINRCPHVDVSKQKPSCDNTPGNRRSLRQFQ